MTDLIVKAVEKSHELIFTRLEYVNDDDLFAIFSHTMDMLEAGELRVVEKTHDHFTVNMWVRRIIIYGMRIGSLKLYGKQCDISFIDKNTFPLRKFTTADRVRVVPPAAGVRRGAYVGKGCIVMPPGFVNCGAYVGEDTMVEGLVGSCSQIGARCHLSAGSTIGGVLSPIEATPVVLGDDVLLGAGSTITQGVIVEDKVSIASGVHLSRATPIIDPIRGHVYSKFGTHAIEYTTLNGIRFPRPGQLLTEKPSNFGPIVPSGALVIQGVSISSCGILKATPTIVKYIDDEGNLPFTEELALRH